MSLLELQRRFYTSVTSEDADLETGWPVELRPGLAVYRHAYRARLIDCLRESFEKTWSWIGDDAFDAAARQHLSEHPPRSWTLDDAARDFTATLASQFPDDPEVEELAWLESQLQQAFTSADAPVLTAEGFADLTSGFAEGQWMELRLSFPPSLAMKAMRTDCAAIWNAIEHGEEMPRDFVLNQPSTIAVWRQEMRPRFRFLKLEEAVGLALMSEGASFGELCDAMVELCGHDEGVAAAGTMLAGWIAESMVAVPAAA